jgi:hypothetical protein
MVDMDFKDWEPFARGWFESTESSSRALELLRRTAENGAEPT